MMRPSRSVLAGAAAGLALYGAAVPALVTIGVLEHLSGSWTLHSVLLIAAIAGTLAGAGLTRAGTIAVPQALVGAGVAMFTWLEIDFHLLRVADATTDLAETLLHAAGITIACVGLALTQRSVPSTAGPSS